MIVNENGKSYRIENGRVVAATAETRDITLEDRVIVGKKLGKVVSSVPSIYGQAIGVRFDDGSFGEFSPDAVERAAEDKLAKIAGQSTADGFEAEYKEYTQLPENTLEDVEEKIHYARQLNLRAAAARTNSQIPLADTILYDKIVTATGVDLLDLKQMQEAHRVVESQEYLESLPQFELPETMSGSFGMTRGGDASWLGAEEIEETPIDEANLAQLASTAVASLTREQLEDPDFMRQVIQYRNEYLPDDSTVRTKFAGLLKEARKAKLAFNDENVRTASVVNYVDVNGDEFNLEDVPIESLYG
jgi:septation ring formation regulator EzrA